MEGLGDMADFMADETGYQQIQGTKPQTLGYGLTDSPAGLAAWILEKFRTWSDCDGDVESVLHQGPAAHQHHALLGHQHDLVVDAAVLRDDEGRAVRRLRTAGSRCRPAWPSSPRRSTGRRTRGPSATYNITHWTSFEKGGHFAAMEQPEALVGDIRAFFRDLR